MQNDASTVSLAHVDPQCAAESADLVYVSDDGPGITRRRFGKGWAFYSPRGKKVTDTNVVDRINALAIPPAYSDVWICPLANGHLQATGRDDRGRKQYRYHERWGEVRDQAKFAKLPTFARALPKLRRTIKKHMKLKGLPREKVLAACAMLLDRTFIRVGNADYATQNGSYGLTTLQDGHADFTRGAVRLEFTAKHGIEREVEVRDSALAKIVRQCQELEGQELLQYLDDAGHVRDVGSGDVNAYLRDHCASGVTAKDFRTWHASVLAYEELAGVELAGSATAINRQVVAAVDAVAEVLGNTRAVCRKCYVAPQVFDAFERGDLADAPKVPANPRGLRKSERATLALLERD